MGGWAMHRSVWAHWSVGWAKSWTVRAKIMWPRWSWSKKLVRSMRPWWTTMRWTVRTTGAVRSWTKGKGRPG